jgi:hypothetical protein
MAQIIQGPWKPFSVDSVSQVGTGTWECTIIKLRPRRPIPTEAMVQDRKEEMLLGSGKASLSPAS